MIMKVIRVTRAWEKFMRIEGIKGMTLVYFVIYDHRLVRNPFSICVANVECLFQYMSIRCLPVDLVPICPIICLFVCQSTLFLTSVLTSVCFSVYPTFCRGICLSALVSVCLYDCLFSYLSLMRLSFCYDIFMTYSQTSRKRLHKERIDKYKYKQTKERSTSG